LVFILNPQQRVAGVRAIASNASTLMAMRITRSHGLGESVPSVKVERKVVLGFGHGALRVLAPPIGAGRLHRVIVDEPLEAGLRKPKKPLSGDRQRI
jgi:hypothetical protein